MPVGSVYFIDFGSARLLPSGPGTGVIIYDWAMNGGHYEPPEGRDAVDPYAYDIYSIGSAFKDMCSVSSGPYCQHTVC